MKTCCSCKVPKKVEKFYRSLTGKNGLNSVCKVCVKAKTKDYYRKNRKSRAGYQKVYARGHRKEKEVSRRKRVFGLLPGDFERMLAEQGGVCAICQGSSVWNRGFCIDHDHKTGKVRGLLCGHCNLALGNFRDSSAVVQVAADYLKKHGN